MSSELALVLWSLTIFQTKHFFCDFVLQNAYQYRNKGTYGHPGGFIHAGLHSIGSLPAVLLLTRSVPLIVGLFVVEFVLHYHIDWTKEGIRKLRQLDQTDAMYWIVFGADQFLHQLTYVAFLAVLAGAAGP
jgi:hypothetical protein